MEIPSAHGLASDTFAHLCGGPGGYVLSTPEYLLLAREVYFNRRYAEYLTAFGGDRCDDEFWEDEQAGRDALLNPFHRWPHSECNAWCIGVLAGDMVAAYRALVAIGGEREFICWQDRHNGYRWRRTGPKFDAYLATIQKRQMDLRAIHSAKVETEAAIAS